MRYPPFGTAALSILVLTMAATSAFGSVEQLHYGSKVKLNDVDEGRALSPFNLGPEFAFWDTGIVGVFDREDVVYINIDPRSDKVSENDIRLTPFGDLPAGSQVGKADNDIGKPLTKFGTGNVPRAELRFLDTGGDWAYNLDDPIYLNVVPGEINSNDVRITNYKGFPAGSRVNDTDPDNGLKTQTLPGMLSFFNSNGNINNAGYAIYDRGDVVYLDTQQPFYVVTINDVRLSM
ncbi:MAG: conserved exported protein of unknown function [Methanothrix sp.]|jgi:hypothetical protein|nr:MAG: conserved exported protein of unknown function [Methanothrix sp.]